MAPVHTRLPRLVFALIFDLMHYRTLFDALVSAVCSSVCEAPQLHSLALWLADRLQHDCALTVFVLAIYCKVVLFCCVVKCIVFLHSECLTASVFVCAASLGQPSMLAFLRALGRAVSMVFVKRKHFGMLLAPIFTRVISQVEIPAAVLQPHTDMIVQSSFCMIFFFLLFRCLCACLQDLLATFETFVRETGVASLGRWSHGVECLSVCRAALQTHPECVQLVRGVAASSGVPCVNGALLCRRAGCCPTSRVILLTQVRLAHFAPSSVSAGMISVNCWA